MINDVLKRLQRLEDLEAIRDLIARYADAVDRHGDPALLKPCFTQDAVWRCKGIGDWKGREAVLKGLRYNGVVQLPWALHYMTQPVVKLAANGKSAKAHYYLWEVCKFRLKAGDEPDSMMIGGWYDSAFRKDAGVWRFSKTVLTLKLASPHRRPEFRTDERGSPIGSQTD
ncbi:MAG: nuclear transport factor 2 family protein [Alphaproteobacteria bacterium]